MRMNDLKGQKFGRLLAVSFRRLKVNGKSRVYWFCKCDCGGSNVVDPTTLRRGAIRSCGCLRKETTAERSVTHGACRDRVRTREYRAWLHMKGRCYDPNSPKWHRYGGRGVRVCDRWREDFTAFLSDMGRCPKGYTLDRIDNDGHYTPPNCRWTTLAVNSGNRPSRKGTPRSMRTIGPLAR